MKTGNSTFYLPLKNVDSEHCARIVDGELSKIQGIKNHRVELNNKRALIETDRADVLPVIVKTIRGIGYDVKSNKAIWPVLQMSCASCAASVESMVKAQQGIIGSSVNFATVELHVEYIPEIIKPEEIKRAVQSIGYDLKIETGTFKQDENTGENSVEKYKRPTILSALLATPLVLISMFFMDLPHANEIMWILATPVLFYFGRGFFIRAWKQLRHGRANMDTLVAMSTGVAYLFSVFNTLFPEFWHRRGLHAHVYFEAAAVVIVFILTGKWLEERAKGSTAAALKKLIQLRPPVVHKLTKNNEIIDISIDEIKQGDFILVKPGESIGVDGAVIAGGSFVDESMLSGESVPVEKNIGSEVYAGSMNQQGSFTFQATKLGDETLLGQIIQMVRDAQGSKPPVQKIADKIAAVFVPSVIAFSMITLLAWIFLESDNGITQGLLSMVTVLVIACPCALGLATPTGIMVGIGKAAEKGILIRDAEVLETIAKADVLLVDKTGTLTEGKPRVIDVLWNEGAEQFAEFLFSLEHHSEHPLAQAVLNHFKTEKGVEVKSFTAIPGKGISGLFNGEKYFAGNEVFMRDNGLNIPDHFMSQSKVWMQNAKSVIWFASSKNILGIFSVGDAVKTTSAAAVSRLKKMGIEVIMLTGDRIEIARQVAKDCGIQEFHASVSPEEKNKFVKELQKLGMRVAMAGDGINDSAALARADVSIAMGQGSDIARHVAKMTLISGDLEKITDAIFISEKTVKIIKQNLFWAFIYNVIGIPIAAGVLIPFTGFRLDPMIAGAAMALSSVSVVMNSLRLRYL